MARPKGQPKVGGRQKGTPNKLTADVKAMVLKALDRAGGVDYLWEQSQANPNAFLTLVGKILPTQISGDPDSPIISKVVHEIIDPTDTST